MKTLIILLLALAAISLQAAPTTNAPSVMLAWDQSTDPTVTGYRLYWGPSTRSYTNSVGTAATNATVTPLVRGATYFFAATATNAIGLESQYSSEVSYTVPTVPPVPGNPKLTVLQP